MHPLDNLEQERTADALTLCVLVYSRQLCYKNMLKPAVKAGLEMQGHGFRRILSALLILRGCH
ncbi:hypothetical protein D3C75_1135050 [compost metagenome]